MTREIFRGFLTLLLAVGMTVTLTGCDVDDDIIIRVEVFIHTDNNNHKSLDSSTSIKIFLSSDQEREGDHWTLDTALSGPPSIPSQQEFGH